MRRTWITALAVPVLLAGFASPASAKSTTPPNEHATITFNAATPKSPGTVVATGPIAGTGTATTKGRHVGRAHFDLLVLTFSTGTVTVKDVRVRTSRKLDSATCTATENGKGLFLITRGTGAYAHAKGRGHFTVTSTLVGTHDASRPHGCSFKTQTGTTVVDATGNVTV